MRFVVDQNVDHPLTLYTATKKANELMAHSYSSLYGSPITGLRFFTVYGPWGRPDMALFKFTANILAGKLIDVFNYGNQRSVELLRHIEVLEQCLGRRAQMYLLPLQQGDVPDMLTNVDA